MEETNNLEQKEVETPVVEEKPVEVVAEETPAPEAPVEETPATVEEPKQEQEVIGAPRYAGGSDTVQTVGVTNNGAIGTANVDRPVKKAPSASKKAKAEDTVAILSTRNVTWNGVGKVYRGYNIVSKAAAEQWLTRDHCRIATPEEVAKGFGK